MIRQDICVITCSFNPSNYRSRPANYDIFRQKLDEANIPLYTIECTFGDQEPVIEPDNRVFHVKSQSVLWQKERLLNLLIQKVPEQYTKIVWADADIIFLNENWINETSELLDEFLIVQPYGKVERLGPNQTVSAVGNEVMESFGSVYVRNPDAHRGTYLEHGHTGYAWAGRRDILTKIGIYDSDIGGSGDTVFALMIPGDYDHGELLHRYRRIKNYLKHVQSWMCKSHELICGSLSYTPGRILHLWHGAEKNRLYEQRHVELQRLDFDPYWDIAVSKEGCWEWTSNKPELHQWASGYFERRKEDE